MSWVAQAELEALVPFTPHTIPSCCPAQALASGTVMWPRYRPGHSTAAVGLLWGRWKVGTVLRYGSRLFQDKGCGQTLHVLWGPCVSSVVGLWSGLSLGAVDILMPLCLNKSRISELHCTHPWERLTQTQAAWGLHVSVLGQEASLCDPPSPLACEQRALGHVFTCGKGCAWHSRSTWHGTPSGQWGWVWLQRICSGGQEVQSPLFPQFICGHLPASWKDHLAQVICSFDQM